MNPPGMPKWQSEGIKHWWRERFMNALNAIQEERSLRSWAEAPQMWVAAYREFSKTPTIIYEVGTFEQYEEGFHAFYRATNHAEATRVKNIAESLQPVDYELTLEQGKKLDKLFLEKVGKKFDISFYSKDFYKIQIREVEIDA